MRYIFAITCFEVEWIIRANEFSRMFKAREGSPRLKYIFARQDKEFPAKEFQCLASHIDIDVKIYGSAATAFPVF